jgi:hypothetical protein
LAQRAEQRGSITCAGQVAAKYGERRAEFDLDPANIKSKTVHLAIPELTFPKQWPHLFRAIIYGKQNGVAVVITRIRG